MKTEKVLCINHLSKNAKRYCSQCRVFVCNSCIIEIHISHISKCKKLNESQFDVKEMMFSLSNDFSKSSKNKCLNNFFHEGKNNLN